MRPKVVRSVHYCPATKKTIERRYTDMTSLEAFPSSSVYPVKVSAGEAAVNAVPHMEAEQLLLEIL